MKSSHLVTQDCISHVVVTKYKFQVSSFYCFTLFSEKLIIIVYKIAKIKKNKQISQRKTIFNCVQ